MVLVFLWITQSYQSDFDMGINVFINKQTHCEIFRKSSHGEHIFFFDNDTKLLEKYWKIVQNDQKNIENQVFKTLKRCILFCCS